MPSDERGRKAWAGVDVLRRRGLAASRVLP